MSDGTSEGSWSRYPVEPIDEHPGRSEVGDDGGVLDSDSSSRVVGLGAICGLRTRGFDDDGRSQSIWVSESARLANGRRVILHDDRGFTIGIGSGAGAVQDGLTPDLTIRTVVSVVLPDDDDCEDDHPWIWLAQLARARGLDVTAEDLRGLPYQVVLTDSVTRWLDVS